MSPPTTLDEETIYSAQGYETAAIRDEADSTDEDSDESRSDSNVASSPLRRQEDDNDYGEENVYRVINYWNEMHLFKINSNYNLPIVINRIEVQVNYN